MMWGESMFGSNMCRLCAGTEEVCIPIFNKDGDIRLLNKIKRCLPISVSEHDEKPKQICYSCMSKLEITYGFIENALAAEFKFESIIQSSYSSALPQEKVLIIQGNDKDDELSHDLDPLLELRSPAEGIWQTVKSDRNSGTVMQHHTSHLQPQEMQHRDAVGMGTNQNPATVTVEHVALHTEQLSSDRVIVLSKVEARGDGHSGEGLGTGADDTDEGAVSDILLMVELKYKDVLGEGTSKVPTITYATSDHAVSLDHFKTATNEVEHQVIELLPQEERVAHLPTKAEVQQQSGIGAAGKKFQCTVCHKNFMRRSNLNYHLIKHTSQRPFSCDVCLKTFCSRWDLTLHKRIHSKQYSCDFCDKAFSVKGKLDRHRRVHTGEKPFQCPHCLKAFSDKRNMQSHVRCHTGEKPFNCDLCGKAFRSKSHLSDHSRVHTIDKPFTCHICGKNFKWKTTLNMHFKFHAGEQYSCDLCGKKFSRRADLKKHVMSHSLERPYSCKVCNKHFKDSNTLRKHSRSHNADKPYSCYQCGKTFHFQWYLSSHMKVHQPLHCTDCGTYFDKKSVLAAHKRTKCVGKLSKCKYCDEELQTEERVIQHMNECHSRS